MKAGILKLPYLTGALLYFACLLFTYQYFVFEKFSYQGFSLDYQANRFWLSIAILLALSVFTNPNSSKPSEFFSIIYFFLTIIPTLVFYIFNEYSELFMLVAVLSLAFPLVWCRYFIFRLPIIRHGRVLAITFCGILFLIFVANSSLNFRQLNMNFDLNSIYDYREQNKEATGIGVLAYFNNWVLFIVGPMFIGRIYTEKVRLGLLAVCFFYVLCFGMTQDTVVLFIPFVIIGALYVLDERQWLMALLPVGLSVLLVVSFAVFYYYDSLFPATWFPRRVFFVPVQITSAYFSYFQENPYVFWSQSNFTLELIDTNYRGGEKVAEIIGRYMGLNSNANTGFLGAGFMHAGYIGVVIYTFIVALLMSLLDGICRSKVDIAAVFLPIFMLYFSSDLPTVLLTKGLLLALVLVIFLRKGARDEEAFT